MSATTTIICHPIVLTRQTRNQFNNLAVWSKLLKKGQITDRQLVLAVATTEKLVTRLQQLRDVVGYEPTNYLELASVLNGYYILFMPEFIKRGCKK